MYRWRCVRQRGIHKLEQVRWEHALLDIHVHCTGGEVVAFIENIHAQLEKCTVGWRYIVWDKLG
jgi:hypothetical protein